MTRSEDRSGATLAAWGIGEGDRARRQWRRFIIVPLVAALLLALLAERRLFRLTNGLMFDLAVSGASVDDPRAVVVRTPPEEVAATMARLNALGARPVAVTDQRSAGAVTIGRAAYGITRRAIIGDGPEVLIRLPAGAAMPELAGDQLDDDSLPPGTLEGLTAVVGMPRELDPGRYQPSGLSDARPLGAADFLARAIHAVQSGQTGREVSGLARLIVLLAAALLLP